MLKQTIQILVPLLVVGLLIGLFTRQRSRIVEPVDSSQSPTRIVSIHPAATEIIYALDQADRLIGVSDYCSYPPEARTKPSVGSALAPNYERLRMLNPQWVIISGQNQGITDFCTQQGLEVHNLHMESVEEIMAGITTLGRLLDAGSAAQSLCQDLQNQIDTVKARAAHQVPVDVFFSLYRTSGSLAGLTTVGPQTYLSELVTLAGGRNIFDDVREPYPQISKETLVKRQPQVIIEPRPGQTLSAAVRQQLREDWGKLDIPAVQQNRIYFPDADRLLKPGPRVGQAALELMDMILPEE